jgi:succinate dehydrogenase / fumarate reductase iron-sulfur subunit
MHLRVYRYNPETDAKPRMQDYTVALEARGKMVLDALLAIKAQDDSLAFRRSCREGVCGSDGLNINGVNALACVTPLAGLKEPREIRPLPRLPVIRDLVVYRSQF